MSPEDLKLGPFSAASEFLKSSFDSAEILMTFTVGSSQGRDGIHDIKEYSILRKPHEFQQN